MDPFPGRSEISADEYTAYLRGDAIPLPPADDAPEAWMTSEKKFQARVVKYAVEHGWEEIYHTYNSASSDPGFPDLVMGRGIRLEIVELKIEGKKPTKQQERWLNRFRRVRDAAKTCGFDWIGVRVWYPDDWSTIEEVLS